MSNGPLVSVIIIFLNEERFLREAIESVFAQTYSNWKLLLVDDGSTDGSTAIARRYVEQYPERVRYLQHEGHQNRGTGASRNLGVRHAKGDYIAFLDADDVWLPYKLERQVATMASHPEAAMIYGATQLWYGWTRNDKDIERDCLQAIGVEPNTLISPPKLLVLYLARKAITPAPSDALLRRQIVADVGGFDESFRILYEDQAFFSKVVLQAPVFFSGECWTKHRKHPHSSLSIWKRTGELDFLEWIQKYLELKGLSKPEFRRVLRRRLWRYRHPTLYSLLRREQRYMRRIGERAKQVAWRTLPVSAQRWLLAQRSGDIERPANDRS
jgi:glycosyltransferase involved in cell wall biosynthesis